MHATSNTPFPRVVPIDEQVQGILAARDINDHSLLTMAAQSGSKEVVEHVLHVLRREKLSEYKVIFHHLLNSNTHKAYS